MAKDEKITLYVDQGRTWNRRIRWKNRDITGFSGEMQLKKSINDQDPSLTLTTENGGIVFISSSNGLLEIRMTDEQTQELIGTYVFELMLINADQTEKFTLVKGFIVIDREVISE